MILPLEPAQSRAARVAEGESPQCRIGDSPSGRDPNSASREITRTVHVLVKVITGSETSSPSPTSRPRVCFACSGWNSTDRPRPSVRDPAASPPRGPEGTKASSWSLLPDASIPTYTQHHPGLVPLPPVFTGPLTSFQTDLCPWCRTLGQRVIGRTGISECAAYPRRGSCATIRFAIPGDGEDPFKGSIRFSFPLGGVTLYCVPSTVQTGRQLSPESGNISAPLADSPMRPSANPGPTQCRPSAQR
jgi:hypothetical protein